MVFKRIIVIFFGIFFITFIAKGWHFATKGFKTNKIIPTKDCVCPFNELPENLVEKFFFIFNQEYTYLDKGCQVYVFESADKKYVIKFLRHHKYKPPFWLRWVSFGKKGKEYEKKIQIYKKSRVKNAFKSYLMAYEELLEETGIVYLHMGETTHLKKKLLIRDSLHRKREIDLDTAHFIVQKKVKKLAPALLKYCRSRDLLKAKMLIDGYLDTIKTRCLKQIRNVDRSGYIRNMGHVGEKVFEIDLGGYRKKKELLTKEELEKEFMYFASHFQKWATKKAPDLVPYIEYQSKKILKSCLQVLQEEK